mgnify:CR=1 FL=1
MFVILSRLKKKGKYSLVFFLWICYDSYEKKDKTFKTKVREPMQMDLTRGGITRPMLLFAGPMIAGNLLQQCYNIADTLIVGRALGASALASVGFSFTLMTFLTSVLLGLCMGSGALWSMLYGAEREEELKRCLFASFVFIGAVAVLLNVGVLALLEPVMTLLRIPAGAWDETRAYLRVVLLGVCFTFLYNYFACLLRSVGNSVAPLAFLAVSTVLNIGLDLIFVPVLHWGVAGVAIATAIAYTVSAATLFIRLLKTNSVVRVTLRDLAIDPVALKRIVKIGLPAGIQSAVFAVANIIIQSAINSLGTEVMAASSAAMSLEYVCYNLLNSFSQACTTFVGQNHGARQIDRCTKTLKVCLVEGGIVALTTIIVIVGLGREILSLFNSDPNIVSIGYIRVCSIFPAYAFSMFYENMSGYLRGFGISLTPALITMICVCGIRFYWVFCVFPHFRTFANIMMVYPISLGTTAFFMVVAVLLCHPARTYRTTQAKATAR